MLAGTADEYAGIVFGYPTGICGWLITMVGGVLSTTYCIVVVPALPTLSVERTAMVSVPSGSPVVSMLPFKFLAILPPEGIICVHEVAPFPRYSTEVACTPEVSLALTVRWSMPAMSCCAAKLTGPEVEPLFVNVAATVTAGGRLSYGGGTTLEGKGSEVSPAMVSKTP